MRHQCAAVIGLLTAALLAPVSQSHAASADPTGYWMKPDAERESRIEVFKCGKKKTNLCAKIAWLKEPNDSKGKPLHDVRNENPAMRGRPILGLPIFTDLVPSAPSTWNGKIYNPEDGRTYTATLTVVSRKQILLKGCKAWLLCGERNWYRTAPPEAIAPEAPAAVGEQQIEASVTPSAPDSAAATAAAEPVAVPSADEAVANASTAPAAPKEMQATVAPQLPAPSQAEEADVIPVAVPEPPAPSTQVTASPVEPPADVNTGGGYGFLAVSTDPGAKAPDSGEDVSNMMLMAKPIAAETAATSAAQPAARTPLPEPMAQPKPPVATAAAKPATTAAAKPVTTAAAKPAATTAAKPVTTATAKPAATATATAAAKPAAAPAAKPVATAAAKPAAEPESQGASTEHGAATPPDGEMPAADGTGAQAAEAETADATAVEAVPLTRRERRLLRKQHREFERAQQDPLLPWLSR
ncbi:MAG TPA: DUF2147 domain-containing protein [Xanthobacteraceae bacterium]|nr:DUF2147 domain-containing protein [Xanthobacteraceae bacterium]